MVTRILHWGAYLALASASATGELVKHQLPQLASVFPQGAEPGTTISATVLGNHLDRATSLVFEQPGISGRIMEGSHTRLVLDLRVAPGAAYGPHYFRVVSPRGASNVLLFRIGDQPHVLEAEPNGRLEQASRIEPPLTLNGRLDRADDIDVFRFEARAGEGFVFDLRAGRNGSGLDPSMILLDAAGDKLRHSEDHFIWDPFFGFAAQRGGTYFVVLQPTRGRARPTHGYQLDIRKAPHLQVMSPLGVRLGTRANAVLIGTGLDLAAGPVRFETCSPHIEAGVVGSEAEQARIHVAASDRAPIGECFLTLVSEHGRSNRIAFWIHDLPVHPGGESLSVPAAISGNARFGPPDRYRFSAREGETLVFDLKAHQFGSPVDMTLEVIERDLSEGSGEREKVLVRNDDAKPPGTRYDKDPKIVHTFLKAGSYELRLSNLWRVTGDGTPYHLEVRQARPRMELLLATDQPVVHPGKGGQLEVEVHRLEGHGEAASLAVTGLPDGIHAGPVHIPMPEAGPEADAPAPQKVTVEFTAAHQQEVVFAPIQVLAGDNGASGWRKVRISSGGGEGATFARISGAVLAVAEERSFELEAQLRSVNLVRGGKATIPVSLLRADGHDGGITYTIENLPDGVAVGPVEADEAGGGSRIMLQAASDAKKGSYSAIAVVGTDSEGRSEQAPPITLIVD